MRRREPLLERPSSSELTDEQAAELEQFVSAPGWRFDGPEWAHCQHAVTQLLAQRWRRTPPEVQQERLADARRGILWPGGIRQYAKRYDPPPAGAA